MDEGSLQPVCEAQQILFVFVAQLAPPYLDIQRPSLSIRHTPITQHLPGVYTSLTVHTACARHTRSTHKLSIICPLPNIHPPSAHHPASTRHLPLPRSSMLIGSGPYHTDNGAYFQWGDTSHVETCARSLYLLHVEGGNECIIFNVGGISRIPYR